MTASPVDLLLARLESAGMKPRKSGRGWLARCPAHEDRSASLSLGEGRDGRALLRCFAGCEMGDVVAALGLEVADLFPPRLQDATPEGKAARREAWQAIGWGAALNVLAREATVVGIVARQLAAGYALNDADATRLAEAIKRIDGAREVLA